MLNIRNILTTRVGISELALVAVCSALGLACMFSGIWLGDSVFIKTIDSEHGVLVMRVYSLIVHAVFFAVAWFSTVKGPVPIHRFFLRAVLIGVALYMAGIIIFALSVPIPDGLVRIPLLWTSFFLLKAVGAPVSVGLVCVFSQLNRNNALRASAVGMLSAFLIYSVTTQLVNAVSPNGFAALGVSVVLMCLACLAGTLGLNDRNFESHSNIAHESLNLSVVKRPASQVITPGLICMLVFSAMMLGYLRNGYMQVDSHAQPYAIVILLVLIVLAYAWKGLRAEHVFYFALLCAASSILLLPVLEVVSPGLEVILGSVGTALFEVTVWILVVWATRNCMWTLRTAAGARLAVVGGHLLGTIAVSLGISLTSTLVDGVAAAGMLVMFAYVVLFIVLLKNPNLKPPFMVHEEQYAYSTPVPWLNKEESDTADKEPKAEDKEEATESKEADNASVEDYEELYWNAPCRVVTETYKLTRRESEVLQLLAHGYSLASMAESMFISQNTMKMHMRNIYTKLDVHSRQDAIAMVDLVREQLLAGEHPGVAEPTAE